MCEDTAKNGAIIGSGGSGLGFLYIGPLILYGLESGFKPSAWVAPRITAGFQHGENIANDSSLHTSLGHLFCTLMYLVLLLFQSAIALLVAALCSATRFSS